jgi:hypothetical protein
MLFSMIDTPEQRYRVIQVMHDFGADWQIRHDPETDIWTAVEYPTPTAQHVIVGRGISDLETKLEAAQARPSSWPPQR